jgi:hexosaminidase
MMFPRLCALAEVTWSAQKLRSYDDFKTRLPAQLKRLDQQNVNYRKAGGQTDE